MDITLWIRQIRISVDCPTDDKGYTCNTFLSSSRGSCYSLYNLFSSNQYNSSLVTAGDSSMVEAEMVLDYI